LARVSLASHSFKGPSPFFDITAWGATGDGSTDDTEALQSALAAASDSGGRVFIPSGHYRVRLSALNDISYVELFGTGSKAILSPLDGEAGPMLRVVQDAYLHDFQINGRAASSSLHAAVQVHNSERITLERLRINNLTGTGV
jgi:hypothetical protein